MFSASLATRSEEYITSVIVGKDMVPRLSFANLEHMKDRAMELVAASTQSKISILKVRVRHAFSLYGHPSTPMCCVLCVVSIHGYAHTQSHTLQGGFHLLPSTSCTH